MTGSAIAIPLMGASGASAADGTTWDKVAECESGGSWSANSGNGYYGGLQFTQEDWEKYGGLDYAPSADQASRSQQIAVAEKILADRGPEAWPNCGPASGLVKESAAANVDTGVGNGTSGSSASPETPAPALSGGLGLSNPAQGASDSPESSSSPDSSTPSASPSTTPEPANSPSATPAQPSSSASPSGTEKEPAGPEASPEEKVVIPALPSFLPPIAPELGYAGGPVYVEGDSALVDTGTLDAGGSASGGGNDVRTNSAAPSTAGHYGSSPESNADYYGLQGGWGVPYGASR
ncbi:transglycosylase family protein [Streptomyces thermoalcalitolerans]|uniref:transglycosylase family protein n=1 Tax=Streptomyces thermoalcalitolerans TaxID=65605 RepID=UPI003CD0AC9E